MKQTILLLCIIGSLAACSPTQVVNSWRDPSVTIVDPGAHKIVVAALIYDQGVRRQVEDYMVTLYPGTATQSYLLFGSDSLLAKNEAFYNQKLKNEGYDGIVLMKQVSENVSQYYVPGWPAAFHTSWGGYWGNGWGNRWATTWYSPGSPGYYRTDRAWHVQVNAYSILEDKLVYAANTVTIDPGGRIPLFMDVCNAVRKQMKRDRFLK